MFGTQKVIWKEGMFLQPQHFQQMERHLWNAFDMRIQAHNPHYYGVADLSVDDEALANGMFSLSRCRGVLPDGVAFDIPQDDVAPEARSFADHFPPQRQSLDVHLALPLCSEGKMNALPAQAQAHTAARYRYRNMGVTDEVLGSDSKEIELGVASLCLLFGGESLDGYASLRIARLVRNAAGQVELDRSHIPPLLRIGGSSYLMTELRTILEILMARISSLSQGRRQVEGGFAEFSGSEETPFRLLQTLNTFTPLLAQYHYAGNMHAYELFSLMNQFTGALCTFSVDWDITKLPRYDHTNFGATFSGLTRIIRSILEADISAGCVAVPVEQVNQATFVCRVPEEKLLSVAKFYLGVSAKVPEKELIVGVLQRIKMCSRERLDLLISSAMPGLQLMHVSNPPEGLSTKPSFLYFSVDQQGELWDSVRATGTIAFYFPQNFPDLKIEMLALKG